MEPVTEARINPAANRRPGPPARPALKPGLRALWRDPQTLQVGVDPRRAVALTGLGRAAAEVLRICDGSRDRAGVLAAARAQGIPAETAERVLALLAAGEALDEAPQPPGGLLPPQARRRLGPELATASLAHRQRDGGAGIIMRRRSCHIRVHGAGRIGSSAAALLAASGIGRVTCRDPRPAGPADLAPAGLHHADLGVARERGAARAVRRIAPDARTAAADGPPDLVVLTAAPDQRLVKQLMEAGVPHLTATAAEAIAVVGPLVVPGRSACTRCIDLTRRDRDPAWPLIAAQLAGAEPPTPACDAVLTTAAAAQCAAQALGFIDAGQAGAAVTNGTLELVLPGWRWRRRTWPMHDDCGCSRNNIL